MQLTHLPTGDTPAFVSPDLGDGWLAVCPDPTALILGRAVSSPPRGDLGREPPAAPGPLVRHRPGALLRHASPDRAGLASAPGRHPGPRLSRHAQQRHDPRSWAPASERRRAPAVAAPQHQLTLPLRRGRRALRAAELRCCPTSSTPSSWSTAAPRPWTWRSGWPGRTRAGRTSSRSPRPTTDGPTPPTRSPPRSPTTPTPWTRDPTGCTPSRRRTPTADSTAAPEAHRYGPEAAAVIADLADRGRPPAAFVCRALLRQRRRHGPSRRLPHSRSTPPPAPPAVSASPTRSRSATAAWARTSGASSSRTSYPTSSPWPRRWATDTPWARSSPGGTSPTRYRSQGYFFSSAGGSPVSAVVGLTVLDVLRDEGLQDNARDRRRTPASRASRPRRTKHPLIGAVHGSGLYLGVEFVRDHETLEPATEETAAICERLRELGVVLQPTSGPHVRAEDQTAAVPDHDATPTSSSTPSTTY